MSNLSKLASLGIGAEILGQLIRFLYCGEILLSRKNLREILKYADYFGIEFLVVKCTELYSNGFKMDFDLAIEIRNVWRSGGHSTLKMALKKANKYLKVSILKENARVSIEKYRPQMLKNINFLILMF